MIDVTGSLQIKIGLYSSIFGRSTLSAGLDKIISVFIAYCNAFLNSSSKRK